MRRIALTLSLIVAPVFAHAEAASPKIKAILETHVLPRFETLAARTQDLSRLALQSCDPNSVALRAAFGDAFDAWISASHLRFGPTEKDDRAFALAFWPDSRGATPRALGNLIAEQDPVAFSIADYTQVSIAARGFYAMEFLLYDDALMTAGDPTYHCTLVQTISADIARTSRSILDEWNSEYATQMLNPTPVGLYRSEEEVLQEMFKSLSTGLQFTADARLGLPLGAFDHPRPLRAEARRSARSSRHVMLSLLSLKDIAIKLAETNATLTRLLDIRFDRAVSRLSDLNDPSFSSVANPQTRIKVEVLRQSVESIRDVVREDLGPNLGVAAGFNSLDGD